MDDGVRQLVAQDALQFPLVDIAADRHPDPSIVCASRPRRRLRDVAKLFGRVEHDLHHIVGIGAKRAADAPVGRLEHVGHACRQRLVGGPFEQDREVGDDFLRETIVQGGFTTPHLETGGESRLSGRQRQRLLVHLDCARQIGLAIEQFPEQQRGRRQPGLHAERTGELFPRFGGLSLQLRAETRAEHGERVVAIELERRAERFRRLAGVPGAQRVPAGGVPLRRRSRLWHQREHAQQNRQQLQILRLPDLEPRPSAPRVPSF